MGALHIPLSWHVLDDSPFSCLPPRQEYRTVEPNVNLSPLSTPLGGEPGWPQSTTSDMERRKSEAFWSLCKHKITVGALQTNLYTLVGVCPTVLLADRSAQVIRTGRIPGYSRRKPQCRRWSSRTQFYSGEWSWQGFLDQSSWPLHTGRHTQGYRYTRDGDKACVIWQAPGRVTSLPLSALLKCFSQWNKCKLVNASGAGPEGGEYRFIYIKQH